MAERKAEMGDNAKLTEAQEQALFFDNLKKVKALKEEMAAVNSQLRNQYKVAKADGFAKKDIDYALKIEAQSDDEAIADMKRRAMLARWMRIPMGVQPDMFDEPDREPIDEKAEKDGLAAGMKGVDGRSPYDPGSKNDKAWMAGWHEGQKTLASAIKAREQRLEPEDEPEDAEEMDSLEDA